jgi:hypothetical protein
MQGLLVSFDSIAPLWHLSARCTYEIMRPQAMLLLVLVSSIPDWATSAAACFPAGTEVMVNMSVSNTGNVRISTISLSSTTWAQFNCASGTGSIALLNPGDTTSCTANYTMGQTAYENAATAATVSGSMSTTITAASASLTASVDATVDIPTSYTASVLVSIDSCTLPAAASGVLGGTVVPGPSGFCCHQRWWLLSWGALTWATPGTMPLPPWHGDIGMHMSSVVSVGQAARMLML